MSGSASRSIGEILDDLRGDFPDISVSKIRFLESQGLISPERSPSGYRQFSDDDLELLRWILRQQRDHYLPLKVIRRRLKDGDGPGAEVDMTAPGGSAAAAGTTAATGTRTAAASVIVDEARLKLPDPAPAADDDVWLVSDGPDPAARAAAAPPADGLWPVGPAAVYSRDELRKESGLDDKALGELESFGLLPAAGPDGFGAEALQVARTCAAFFAFGVEARHLRMYKRFSEQEAAFLSQVVPTVGTRDPAAAERAAGELTELARLGAALRLALLRVSIGPPPRGA